MLAGTRILIGIGGGVAVYRVAELARLLIRQGAEVRCIMTRSAQEFVTPLTFEVLTGQAVYRELFDLTAERLMGHIALARWADVLLVAPATANLLAKVAHGVADDLLTTVLQVREGPVLVAPAMNVSMWQSSATQANATTLRERGVQFIGPVAGNLACGEEGEGRLAEPADIMAALVPLLDSRDLAGQRWVINAGPTQEAWDAVRILSNRASGRLGSLLAEAAALRGAEVQLIAGPGTPATSAMIRRQDVGSAAEMLDACEQAAAGCDVFVASAAVSDYRFAEPHAGKLKRGGGELQVRLLENPDIVAHVTAMSARPRLVIAFAAESTEHVEHARGKMQAKGADAIFANDVGRMGGDSGSGWWLAEGLEQQAGEMDKVRLAAWLVARIKALQEGKDHG